MDAREGRGCEISGLVDIDIIQSAYTRTRTIRGIVGLTQLYTPAGRVSRHRLGQRDRLDQADHRHEYPIAHHPGISPDYLEPDRLYTKKAGGCRRRLQSAPVQCTHGSRAPPRSAPADKVGPPGRGCGSAAPQRLSTASPPPAVAPCCCILCGRSCRRGTAPSARDRLGWGCRAGPVSR